MTVDPKVCFLFPTHNLCSAICWRL